LRVVLFLLLCAWAAIAGDISGIWTGQAPGRNGDVEDVTLQFKQEGAALTGKLYGDGEDVAIADGKIAGDTISFSVTLRSGSTERKFLYSGTVEGAQMHLTRKRESPEPGAERQNAPQNFTLRRMT
jgi:hypothetical protein